jgi:hypothetical protein
MRSRLSPVLVALIAFGSPASAKITVTKAEIASGKLIVTGKSTSGNQMNLDGAFTAKINAKDVFRFSLTYLPDDCIVELKVTSSSTVKKAVVANCAPRAGNSALIVGTGPVVVYDGDIFKFLGPTVTLDVLATQHIVLHPSAYSFTTFNSSGSSFVTSFAACHRRLGQDTLVSFDDVPYFGPINFGVGSSQAITKQSTLASERPGVAGRYEVGLCVLASDKSGLAGISSPVVSGGLVEIAD